MKVECERAQKLISLYLAGDLSSEDRNELMSHLAECESCREAFKEAKRYEAALKSIFNESVSRLRSPKSRVLRKIKAEGGRRGPKSLINWFVFIVLMAILCLLMVIAYVSYAKIKQENTRKSRKAKIELGIVMEALGRYRAEQGAYPTGGNREMLKTLLSKEPGYLELDKFTIKAGELTDPWGTPYNYKSSGETVVVYSSGPDKEDDDRSGDDITP